MIGQLFVDYWGWMVAAIVVLSVLSIVRDAYPK